MHAVAPAPRPPDRTPRAAGPVQRQPLPEADERDARGLLHDEPAPVLEGPVQRKAVVGPPDDPLEHEADRAADRIVRGEAAPPLSRLGAGTVRRCAACGSADCDRGGAEEAVLQRQPLDEEEEPVQARLVQRQPVEEEEEPIQMRREGGASGPSVHEAAARAVRSPGPGAPIRPEARRPLEAGFGVDLGDVRVHDDAAAHRSAHALRAQAFAHDRHIWLGRGASQADLHLMAHETAHVLQQDGVVRRRMAGPPPEAEASPPPVEAEEETAEAVVDAVAESAAGGPPPAEALGPPPRGDVPGGDGAEAPADVEVLMPEPPTRLSGAERRRLQDVDARTGEAADEQTDLPTADAQKAEARGAVDEPQAEADAQAGTAALAEALGTEPAPSPEVEELCERINRVLESMTPTDEETLVRTKPDELAASTGHQLDTQIDAKVQAAEGKYADVATDPHGTPDQIGTPLQPPPASVETTDPRATAATPRGVGPEAVSLDADVEASAARRDEAGMTTDTADAITDPANPVTQAREAQGELEETAARDPAEVLAEQRALLSSSQADMGALQARAVAALQASRAATVREGTGQQDGMVTTEEQTRERVAGEAQAIFDGAQGRVHDLLRSTKETATRRWDAGIGVLATAFRQRLKRVEDWVKERHGGTFGGVTSTLDDIFGLPIWVPLEYTLAERAFGKGVCALLREISTEVNGVILACDQIIADARTAIDDLYAPLDGDLREWAEAERAAFQARLDGLATEVGETRRSLTEDLTERAAQSVDEVRAEVHALREAAKGLIGRVIDAIAEFVEDPLKFIVNGLLRLVGIPPPSFWAVVARIADVIWDIVDDPLGFAGNLLSALGEGFQRFVDHLADHLREGLVEWLFSGLGAVDVEIPRDFSLQSVITFFLQLMGITWDRVRTLLARHVGEENVALLERAYEIVASLIEMGPAGVFELIREHLDPQRILSMVVEAAVDFLVEALVSQVTARVLLLFNPVGAIAQAVEAIYRVLKWIFQNAARIFSLVETVVGGIADLLAGNTARMAEAVEGALARLVAPVIDFFADYLSLGDLPDKIADVIRRMQTWVEGILDRVIGAIAGQARRLLAALGIGGEEAPGPEAEGDGAAVHDREYPTEVGEEDHTLRAHADGDRVVLQMASETWRDFPVNLGRIRDRETERLRSNGDDDGAVALERDINAIIADADAIARGPVHQALLGYRRAAPHATTAESRERSRQEELEAQMEAWEEHFPALDDRLDDLAVAHGFQGDVDVSVGDHFVDVARNERIEVTRVMVREGGLYGVNAWTVGSREQRFYSYQSHPASWAPVGPVPPAVPFHTAGSTRRITVGPSNYNFGGRASIPTNVVPPGYDAGGRWNRKGHLVGDALGGPASLQNLVAMTYDANHTNSGMRGIEGPVERDIRDHEAVYEYEATPSYGGGQVPPTSIDVRTRRLYPTTVNPPYVPLTWAVDNT